MGTLYLTLLPTMQTSEKSIHIPVENEIQAVLVAQAYGIDKLDDASLVEYHLGVFEGNPYQEHLTFADFKAKLVLPERTYVVMYTDKKGTDQEDSLEAVTDEEARKEADVLHAANKENWSDVGLGVYDKGEFETVEYIPGSTMVPTTVFGSPMYKIDTPGDDLPSSDESKIGRGMITPIMFTAGSWPDDKEYIPTAEEVASALEDADKMNFNMRTYGTIDVPAMAVYTLYYTDECHIDHEDEFEAFGDTHALFIAGTKCRGCEGLWTGISLTSSNENDIDFRPFG